ncbi:hypothetical protein LTR67_006026 [Exophiala xenobiotica]
MAPISSSLENLSNSLITSKQMASLRAIENEDDQSLRVAQCQLTSAAGILLRLAQEVIAHAIVLLQRFIVASRPEDRGAFGPRTYSAAAIYLAAKVSTTPVSARSVVNVYAYLTSKASPLKFVNPGETPSELVPAEYYVTEGTYEKERQRLFVFLGVSSKNLAKRVFEHLNAGLLSPQLLYLTHQPNALAVGAIYLAARETGVKLLGQNWWEVFDVDREDLGFLVLAYGSTANFAEAEMEKWKQGPLALG